METDQLEFVRKKLSKIPPSGWTKVAAASELTIRTLYNVLDTKRNPNYSTVKKLYAVLKTARSVKKK
jgi:DNA-binding phage protein